MKRTFVVEALQSNGNDSYIPIHGPLREILFQEQLSHMAMISLVSRYNIGS
jgi:hypothetical protein